MSEPTRHIPDLLGSSEAILNVKDRLSLAAKVDRPVLILGERGTGKELAAARLHFLSRRWSGPYVTLNCAALSPGLLDAELFGHEAGAFTGATRRRPGRFEAADGGCLFLDEISHLGLEAQARILRVVEYGSFQLVGSAAEKKVDVRIAAATNADLKKMCRAGTFLPDLWDRLSFEVIELPPLRDRVGDVPFLAHYFGARMAQELGREALPVFSPEAVAALEAYSWPGNVRELKNVAERAVYQASGEKKMIGPELLKMDMGVYLPASDEADFGSETVRSAPESKKTPHDGPMEEQLSFPLAPGQFDELMRRKGQEIFRVALSATNHNQIQAAEMLGLTYHRFRYLKGKMFPKG
ncbi:MAG: sigma 54-interacting transcriptional regulator [Deltaproteobacteria bacterium]|jgi:psp operon transcriptional activator|nr:sigma 54-interacting transcriptional regulator [Deltaproteobacteria bacterium]